MEPEDLVGTSVGGITIGRVALCKVRDTLPPPLSNPHGTWPRHGYAIAWKL